MSEMKLIHRRTFLAGIGAMLAAPAIVHYGNLMPVRALHLNIRRHFIVGNHSLWTYDDVGGPSVTAYSHAELHRILQDHEYDKFVVRLGFR